MNQKTGGARGRVLGMALACATFVMLAAFALMPSLALAAEVSSLDVKQVYSTTGTVPDEWKDGTFTYELKANDGAALPAGATDGAYDFTMTGNSTASIGLVTRQAAVEGVISYDTVGVYDYTMRCVTEPADDNMHMDGSVYSIRVAVENDDEGDGIHVAWVEIKDKDGKKPATLEFDPSYKGKAEPAQQQKQEAKQPTVAGKPLAKTGDASWGLAVFSGILLAAGVGFVVVSLFIRRKNQGEQSAK